MKALATMAVALFALSGCAGTAAKNADRGPSSDLTHQCVAKTGPSCRADLRWDCGEGFHDACKENPAGIHQCVPDARSGCASRIMIHCPDGFENGCNTGATARHACVPVATAVSCKEAAEFTCPEGFRDACQGDREPDGPNNDD